MTTGLAVQAADLGRRCGLATADAVTYATARKEMAELLTCDARFSGLDGVVCTAKTGH